MPPLSLSASLLSHLAGPTWPPSPWPHTLAPLSLSPLARAYPSHLLLSLSLPGLPHPELPLTWPTWQPLPSSLPSYPSPGHAEHVRAEGKRRPKPPSPPPRCLPVAPVLIYSPPPLCPARSAPGPCPRLPSPPP